MSSEDLKVFLNAEFEKIDGCKWMAERTGNMVFVYGAKRDQNDSNNLAIISFFSVPPQIEITIEGKGDEEVLLAIWEKYLADQNTDDSSDLENTMKTVQLSMIFGGILLCLIVIATGLYVGSIIF
jgi:hypothetical protein